jgi:hypothetical protein
MHGQRISIHYIAGLACGLTAVGPAVAASPIGDVDWNSILNWRSYTEWHSLVLIGSIALLIVALVVKGVAAKSARESESFPTAADRIGIMPIEPPESGRAADSRQAGDRGRTRGTNEPVANFDVA